MCHIFAAPKVAVTENECTEYPCLVFNDEFDTLNFDTWEHEITAGGGGVSYSHILKKNKHLDGFKKIFFCVFT